MKKRCIIAVLIVCIIFLLCGCEKKETPETIVVSTSLKDMPTLVGDIPCAFPLVKEPTVIRILATTSAANESYDDMYIWNKYEELTGVDVQWTTVSRSDRTAKVKDALSKKLDYDLILRAKTSQTSLTTYGESGLILDLNKDDLLKNNAPNLYAYLHRNPDTLASIMNPDGSIYAIPQVNSGPELRVSRKLFVNKKWLERVGLQLPSNLEEFHQMLLAFRDQDANGNGDPDDEIPLSPVDWPSMQEAFYGAFGLGNRGVHNMVVDSDPVRFIPTSEDYKKFIEFFKSLYDENLINRFFFTTTDNYDVKKQWTYAVSTDKIGVFAYTNLAEVPSSVVDNWVAIEEALEGPDGYKLWTGIRANFSATGAAFIPSTCKNPELVLRWLDYFWTDEGTLFYHMGIEGETFFVDEDGKFDYVQSIYDQAKTENLSFDSVIVRYTPYPGGANPTVEIAPYFMGGEMAPVPAAAARKLFKYQAEEYWPSFIFTNEENQKISSIQSDITKYSNACTTDFIIGTKPLSDWESYVEKINSMGLSVMLEVYQSAVDRYHSITD